MILDSLERIPYKLFLRVSETSEYYLLDTSKKSREEATDEEIKALSSIWDKMYAEHDSKQSNEQKKVFQISKNIDQLLTTNKVVLFACFSLRFEMNTEMVDIIRSYNHKLSTDDTESYFNDLDRIEREANAYTIKAERYKSMLPEEQPSSKEKYTIDDIMASYSAILGVNIGDFNTITYTAYKGYEKQVNAKINSLKNSNDGK